MSVEFSETPLELPVQRGAPFDPPASLGRWREEAPLRRLRYPDGHLGWLATGYTIVRQVLADPRFSSRSELMHIPVRREGAATFVGEPALPGWLVDMDPPQHTRLRRILGGYFTQRRAEGMRELIAAVIARCLGSMRQQEPPVDLVRHFAVPVAALVVCELLGVPESGHEAFQQHSATLLSLDATAEQAATALTMLDELLSDVVRYRRTHPAPDVLSGLVRTELTESELIGAGVLLLTAGHDSVANMIALGAFLLLCRPDQLAKIRSGQCSIDDAVEELLRYLTVFQFGLPRVALEDVEINGRQVRTGECVTLSLPAANRDPAFLEASDELDVCRSARGHLALGHGIHKCLGQHLARVELQSAYQYLFTGFPDLRLAAPVEQIEMSVNSGRYGVRELPVAW